MHLPNRLPPPLAIDHNTPSINAQRALCSLHLEVVELARLRARDELGPVHRDAHQRGRRVEGATLLEAQHTAVALGDLAGRVGNGAVAAALLDQVEGACEGGVCVWRPCVRRSGGSRVHDHNSLWTTGGVPMAADGE